MRVCPLVISLCVACSGTEGSEGESGPRDATTPEPDILYCDYVELLDRMIKNDSPRADVADPAFDVFGVPEVYPTISGGREWFLPDTADVADAEWKPKAKIEKTSEKGVFRVTGSPRHDVASPSGKAWWRNVEITAYLKYVGESVTDPSQAPHWTFYARGERHTSSATADPATINFGVPAPPGTATWPGYPFTGSTEVDAHCLGTSLKGAIYPDGTVWWKKEISHIDGYTAARGTTKISGGMGSGWFGHKVVIRNSKGDTAVHMETWIDATASGEFEKVSEADDDGKWLAGTTTMDGCTAAPFSYTTNQQITWAGPNVTFRVDNLIYDFKWASAREIAPLP